MLYSFGKISDIIKKVSGGLERVSDGFCKVSDGVRLCQEGVCRLVDHTVIGYNPTFASPVKWDQAD